MTREDAIKLIVQNKLKDLNPEERQELLEIIIFEEDWSDDPDWAQLPANLLQVLDEFAHNENYDSFDFQDPKYDPIIMIGLKSDYDLATNDFLLKLAQNFDSSISSVEGEAEIGEACPCCGYETLSSRGNLEICRVCWWEDDGQDNEDADQEGGPNGMSLTVGRENFKKSGSSDPSREDLREFQDPPEKYRKIRFINEE